MSAHTSRTVVVGASVCRVWEKDEGQGGRIFWLASAPMLLHWGAFHDAMAAHARLIVAALPGYPGSVGHDDIDDHLSWCLAARDLLEAGGFQAGDTLMGSSTAGALAAEVAALWPDWVGRLVLIAPCGLYDVAEPTRDMFALQPKEAASMFAANPDLYMAQLAVPEGEHPVTWSMMVVRGNTAAARFLWPLGDTRLATRLRRIVAPTLVIWGARDRLLPPSYAQRFAQGIGGNARVHLLAEAGHLAELDQPLEVAAAVETFCGIE